MHSSKVLIDASHIFLVGQRGENLYFVFVV